MDKLQQGIYGQLPELGGVELEAGRLPLSLPCLVVGAEDPVPEEIADGVTEIRAFGEIGELGFEKVLQVTRVGSDDAVEAAKPRAFECEGTVLAAEDLSEPLVEVVGLESYDKSHRG